MVAVEVIVTVATERVIYILWYNVAAVPCLISDI